MIGLGIDLIRIRRVGEVLARHGDRFLERIFTERERTNFRKPLRDQDVAGRFAAKEAVLKVLGTGRSQGVLWHDVEILHLPSGQPTAVLSGRAAERLEALGGTAVHVSITHEGEYAASVAAAV